MRANSLQKAQYLYDRCGCDCFADDTGLEVDALGGAPGVYTARYAGEDKDFNKNMDKVLYELQVLEKSARMAKEYGLNTKPVSRRARFKSVVTLIYGGKMHLFDSEDVQNTWRRNIDRDIAAAYKQALAYATGRIADYCRARGASYLLVDATADMGQIFFEHLTDMEVIK